MSQTAMQELVDHINGRLIASKELGRDTDYIENILENAISLLNVEKEQITDAYWEGGQWVPNHYSSCEKYYNKTFNTGDK